MMIMRNRLVLIFGLILTTSTLFAQGEWGRKFEQLEQELPTPNTYRTGSGAPGVNYWQQRADYKINVKIDDKTQLLTGEETITYYNNSPDALSYLWVQLDQNVRAKNNLDQQTKTNNINNTETTKSFQEDIGDFDYEGGYTIKSVTDASGKPLSHMINRTMMRIDLPKPLKSGEKIAFSIAWSYHIYDRMMIGGRGGYEYFPADDNYAYTCAQWFPRMAVYDDYEGWQNKQFIGRGEFALAFGDYEVNITVPADHIVAATGQLQNEKEVLTKTQYERFQLAKKTFDKPVVIVTQAEAEAKEKTKVDKEATWTFKAQNVRDFAFASSRKYIWDAQAVKLATASPLAMSYYPKEGNPLWERESTKAIKNTLEVYSERTFDYPYPVAISVNAANQGMEYPMICFNYGRPRPNGTYSQRTLDGNISVIIHEIGHNYFPMIVNSDERQWTWMDEGLNTFLEKETKRERYPDLDLEWGTPKGVIGYMKGNKKFIRPIMTNSEQVQQFGFNAYGKPAAALTVLREVVMGPELFDMSFKAYANRWKFKHPKPADFFRTMEDASAVDLDWFWRGWFYGIDHVDVSVDDVKWFRIKQEGGDIENTEKSVQEGDLANTESNVFNQAPKIFTLTETKDMMYGEYMNKLDDKAIINRNKNKNFYEVTFSNQGGLVTPLLVQFTFKDGSKTIESIPAEIWRSNEYEVSKVFSFDKEVTNISLDPAELTGDTEKENNTYPRQKVMSRFDTFKKKVDKKAKVDIEGEWAFEADMPQGTMQGSLTFSKKRGKYSGKVTLGNSSEIDMNTVNLEGNVLHCSFTAPDGKSTVIKIQSIVEDKMLNGDLIVGTFGSFPISAEKE